MAAPAASSLYTTTFLLAILITLLIAASLRLLAILPNGPFKPKPFRRRPIATRVLIVLGSGGHTHEMFYLLRDLDTRKYTHRTYVVSSGDAFSAGRAVEFERELEARELEREKNATAQDPSSTNTASRKLEEEAKPACTGPSHYNLVTLPRARRVHQTLLTSPITSLYTLLCSFPPLLSSPPLLPGQPPQNPYEAAAADLPDLIITNGPATGVIVVLASLILRFFDIRGAQSRGKCRTIYAESFARVTRLSLSGKILVWCVDRFLVQWEELEGAGRGRAEFWGVLV
ncbi:oligosaccharide biosynthesis protein Alg14 like protein [Westerdykella ornata]|uniref:UDP-N-acetylglucosamine transferase subunit ALG14 n=1 Tax=Westerdykella ornata TaxID=318751 RepID=A0A6A6JA20_WESOR|nr:oligosaccharide biosynthesis protein Alg14 like protein [Westerdykella ornata]KAF2273242.1 oligosaccharide biosynthesis protein Alg14 like protein [Westerdykella ornata]